jgi:hypothetical protein
MNKRNRKRKGLLLAPDDLAVGRFIAVHSIKGSSQLLPFFGLASEVMAINLPFVIVRPVGGHDPATVDVRYVNLMPVTDDYVRAQVGQQQRVAQQNPAVNADKQGA